MGEGNRVSRRYGRYEHIEGSRTMHLVSRLSHDLFNSTRLLPPGHKLKVTLDRSSTEFSLIRDATNSRNYKIKFDEIKLTVPRVKISDSIARSTDMHFRNGSTIYLPFTRTDAKPFEIPRGSMTYRASSIYTGVLPERLILVFCDPESLGNGSYDNNPVIFPARKYGVSEVQFYLNESEVLAEPYKIDWEKNHYQESYQRVLRVMGLDQSLVGCYLSFIYYGRDHTIFAANMRDIAGVESGNVSVNVKFNNATNQAVAGLLIAEYRSCLMLDSGRVRESDYY